MIKFLTKAAITSFIFANSIIVMRMTIFLITFVCLNIFYTKWETLLLATDPSKLIYLLTAVTVILLILLIWVIASFQLFVSPKGSKKTIEIKKSIKERSNDYEKIKDVQAYPILKSHTQKKLED
tara:strand:+ start:1079 stop:1450 length:372 start_codon:yes stop_codon:yes gene_type:complete